MVHSPPKIMPAYTAESAYLSSNESRKPPKGVAFSHSLAMAPSKTSQYPDKRSRTTAKIRFSCPRV